MMPCIFASVFVRFFRSGLSADLGNLILFIIDSSKYLIFIFGPVGSECLFWRNSQGLIVTCM